MTIKSTRTFNIIVGVNQPPKFEVDLENQSIHGYHSFKYEMLVSDHEKETISFSITGMPSWLSFDETSREFTGTPTNLDVAISTVTVTLSDSVGTTT